MELHKYSPNNPVIDVGGLEDMLRGIGLYRTLFVLAFPFKLENKARDLVYYITKKPHYHEAYEGPC